MYHKINISPESFIHQAMVATKTDTKNQKIKKYETILNAARFVCEKGCLDEI